MYIRTVDKNSLEDMPLGLDVREREFDLSVDTTRPNESWIKRFDLVCGHDDLDVASSVEAIKLVEEFQHGALDFPLASRR